MEALRKKLNSRRGASILLALLFLLVCMMAAASILMAAASDAGKIRSNKEEQQKYLTLSSALNLLCGDLERVEYVGKYSYKETPVYKKIDADEPLVDEEGNPLKPGDPGWNNENAATDGSGGWIVHHRIHTYDQEDGELRKRTDLGASSSDPWGTDDLLEPLFQRLEFVFANHFIVLDRFKIIGDDYPYNPKTWSGSIPPDTFTLKLTAGVDSDTYGGLADQVQVKVELREDGSILLTATLMEPETIDATGAVSTWKPTRYTMTALLRPDPDRWPEQRLVLDPDPSMATGNQTEPIRWKLDCFVKGEGAEPSAVPSTGP